jgi:hypothetical protein
LLFLKGKNIIDIDNAKLYGISTSCTTVNLNIVNTYTSNDTLEITKGYSPNLKLAGPFTNNFCTRFQIFSYWLQDIRMGMALLLQE